MFLVFEGIDGSGKDTQIDLVNHMLRKVYKDKIQVLRPVLNLDSNNHRDYIMNTINVSAGELDSNTIANIFIENMIELSIRVNDLLNKGYIILMNRWYYSTIAYNGINISIFNNILNIIRNLIKSNKLLIPDLVIYLDVPPVIAIERVIKRDKPLEVYENLDTLKKVSERYYGILTTQEFEDLLPYDNKAVIIPGNLEINDLTNLIIEEIYNHVGI